MQPRTISKGYPLRRYVCYSVSRTNKAMIKSDHCTNRLHPYTLEELDNIIISEVKKLAVDEKYLKSIIQEDAAPIINEAELCQDRLAELDKQTDKLLNLYQIGAVDLSQIQDRLTSLKQERNALTQTLNKVSTEMPMNIQQIQDYATAFQEALAKNDYDQVNNIIHILIDKIVVLNEDIEIHWTFC